MIFNTWQTTSPIFPVSQIFSCQCRTEGVRKKEDFLSFCFFFSYWEDIARSEEEIKKNVSVWQSFSFEIFEY